MLQFNTRHRCARLLLSGASLFALGAVAVPAHAQTTDDAVQGDETMTQDVVVVTATRREESLQDVPIAISVLSGAQLEESGVVDVLDLPSLAAGLQVKDDIGLVQVYVRGIGNNELVIGAESGVAVHRDGIYLQQRHDIGMGFFDVERIEVLRGPQGTLYGRNATGGALNIITNEPTADFDAGGALTLGSYDLIETEGFVSGPIVEGALLARAAYKTRDHEGFTPNMYNGQRFDDADFSAARVGLTYLPTDNVRIDLIADASRDYSIPAVVRERSFGRPVLGELVGGTLASGRAVNYDAETRNEAEVWGIMARGEVNLDSSVLTSISGYRQLRWFESQDYDGTDAPAAFFDSDFRDTEQFSQELTLASSGDGSFQWLIGASYFYDFEESDTALPLPIFGLDDLAFGGVLETNAYAVFGEASYSFAKDFTLTLGGRYSSEEKSIEEYSIAFGGTTTDALDDSWANFSPKVALTYEFSDAVTAYGTVNQGFKAGGFSVTSLQGSSFDQEEVTNYEAGLKTSFLDGAFQANIAAFYMDYTDFQVRLAKVNEDTMLTDFFVGNAPSAEIKGIELDYRSQVSETLAFDGSIAYLDARFADWQTAVDGANGNAVVNVTGNRMISAPEWSANFGATYSIPVDNFGAVIVRGDYAYQSKVYFTPFEREIESQEGVGTLNARITFESDSGQWSLAGWVKNATDELVANNRRMSGSSPHPVLLNYQAPRTFGATLKYRY